MGNASVFMFQSPSLRGSGRFRRAGRRNPEPSRWFQSPSLRGSGRFTVVMTTRRRPPPCFNPLHCGSVVASDIHSLLEVLNIPVSIPFIAGQWSLLCIRHPEYGETVVFQSPSLRGSGRFRGGGPGPPGRQARFNPLHCGAVVASGGGAEHGAGGAVSIPFIAGQWSLPLHHAGTPPGAALFQSPSLRGSGRFHGACHGPMTGTRVSIPFIAGQWSLPRWPPPARHHPPGFNPLHCGAVVASRPNKCPCAVGRRFQSPSLRGSGRFRGS